MKTTISILLIVIFGYLCATPALAAKVEKTTEPKAKYQQPDYLNSIKITFLSWASGSTKLSYERAFPRINQSGEICSSLICAGHDKYNNNPLGFTLRYGHKFFLGNKDQLSLRGFYLRPEAIYSYYTYDSKLGARTEANMGALIASVGYQYIWRRLLVDAWFGGGYAFGKESDTGYHHGFELWHWLGTYNPNIAMSFSIRLGVCF
jgi:hypothetical protein